MSGSSEMDSENKSTGFFKDLLELTNMNPDMLDEVLKRICLEMGFCDEYETVIEYGHGGKIEYGFHVPKHSQIAKPKLKTIISFEELVKKTGLHPLDLELGLRKIAELSKEKWGLSKPK